MFSLLHCSLAFSLLLRDPTCEDTYCKRTIFAYDQRGKYPCYTAELIFAIGNKNNNKRNLNRFPQKYESNMISACL